ncbi:hypothetical protein R1flu_006175 [Riccia fluitans]|uniref:Uncharacterized protein n=1 Tax=Riccia fluitans TaxID=41844 RepID=A0ABD1YV96_9MARC
MAATAVGHGALLAAALRLAAIAVQAGERPAGRFRGKEPEILKLPKEGELMPEVPPPPQKKGKGPRKSQI